MVVQIMKSQVYKTPFLPCLLTNHLTEDESNVMSLVERSIDVKNSVLVIGTPMLRKDLKWPGFKSIPLKTP